MFDIEQPMHALDALLATHAVSELFDVERRGRDVKSRVECASVGVFRSIENPNQRPDVFEARLTWIGFVGLDPCDILRGRIDARFDATVPYLDGRRRDQLMRWRGVGEGVALFFKDRMISFQSREKIGLVRDDFGGDLDLAAHGGDGHEGAFELPCLGKMVEKLGNVGDLVGFFGHARRAFVAKALSVCNVFSPLRFSQCLDPALETAPEKHGIDAIDQCAQPTLAGNALIAQREFSQKIQMMLAPRDDIGRKVDRQGTSSVDASALG